MTGGFRAALNVDWLDADVAAPIAVSLNGSGRVVKAAGTTGVVGVVVCDRKKFAGDIVDIMTSGEITDCAGLAAGTVYYGATTGVISSTAPGAGVNGVRVGQTVEADRLIVRVQAVQG